MSKKNISGTADRKPQGKSITLVPAEGSLIDKTAKAHGASKVVDEMDNDLKPTTVPVSSGGSSGTSSSGTATPSAPLSLSNPDSDGEPKKENPKIKESEK